MWDRLRLNPPPQKKKKKLEYLAKKENKREPHSSKARQGHIKHVGKNSGYLSKKRRGQWALKEFGVLCLNQPV